MAFGRAGDRSGRAIFTRVVGSERGTEFSHLAVATIRAVAQGVIGVAFIQAILVGVCLLIAGVPWAGVLAGIVLVLGLAPGAGGARHAARDRLPLDEWPRRWPVPRRE